MIKADYLRFEIFYQNKFGFQSVFCIFSDKEKKL
jgi:hypothetical protein